MGAVHQTSGLQVPLQEPLTSDVTSDGSLSAGMTPQQSQFHRAQSVTSAVDYEYFDVGIGQVEHTHTNAFWLLTAESLNASPSCFSPSLACLDRPMEA